ncbi:alpha/beta hydrolase [Patescibacteria group bacterium]|nr:alpha/beta hydrolase [Patescibacteria group bacterium]
MQIQEHRIIVQGIRVTYKTCGEGSPIVVLHGWGGSSDTWKQFLKECDTKNVQFIIPDLPGFGKSDDPPVSWTVSDYVHFVLDFFKYIHIQKAVLIGHSFGGRIAIKLAVRYPEKVSALILVASAGVKHTKSLKQRVGNFLAKYGRALFELPVLNKFFTFSRKLLYKALREQDYVATRGVMKDTFKNVIDEDLTDLLGTIALPTLIVWGTNDSYVPVSDAEVIHSKIKGSMVELIQGGRHGLHRDVPKRLYRIIMHFVSRP